MCHRMRRLLALLLIGTFMFTLLPITVLAVFESDDRSVAVPVEIWADPKIDYLVDGEDEKEMRSVDELLQQEDVRTDEDGNILVIKSGPDSELTAAEINSLFASEESTFSAAPTLDPSLKLLGITEDRAEDSAKLHGGMNQFLIEIGSFMRNHEIDLISAEAQDEIITLICGGYTYAQAKGAVRARQLLNLSITDLLRAKESELLAKEDEIDLEKYDESIESVAVKLGVPQSILLTCVEDGYQIDALPTQIQNIVMEDYKASTQVTSAFLNMESESDVFHD